MALTSIGDTLVQKVKIAYIQNYLYTAIETINKLEPLNFEWHEKLIDFIYG